MKVYAPWACVCLAEFGDMCKGVITPRSHVHGFHPPAKPSWVRRTPRLAQRAIAGGASLHVFA